VKFWGVRGSFPCPQTNHIRYGGNTSCVSIQAGEQLLVLDAGTGIRGLGQWLLEQSSPANISLLFSHVHWDHINGFPFFDPAYRDTFEIDVYAGSLRQQNRSIREVMRQQMGAPTFPIDFDTLAAQLRFHDFRAGESFVIADTVSVNTVPLNHPNEATGYRFEYKGTSVCYVTDTEHSKGQLNPSILSLIRGADLVIYDCTYTDEEFEHRIGWGHSTWQEGIRLARAAGAKQLAIFHHDPDHDDDFMDEVARKSSAEWSGALVAREGMTLALGA